MANCAPPSERRMDHGRRHVWANASSGACARPSSRRRNGADPGTTRPDFFTEARSTHPLMVASPPAEAAAPRWAGSLNRAPNLWPPQHCWSTS